MQHKFMAKEILVVGKGGREHAFGLALKRSSEVLLYTAPGNAGTAEIGQNVPISEEDILSLAEFASQKRIDLTVVGPEGPLSKGIVNEFRDRKLPIFGPTQEATQIETSKIWQRQFLASIGIPGPEFAVFGNYYDARDYVASYGKPCVVKADGLCAGKGVSVCNTEEEAQTALRKMMVNRVFGPAGDRVVVEEKLEGYEVSVFCFTDGKTVLPLLPAEDYKAVFDGDHGPNTGGIGGVCPHWEVVNPRMLQKINEEILKPTIDRMAEIGRPFQGILYGGLMMTKNGPKVLEFNCRGGDPETQLILPLLQNPLLGVIEAATQEKLNQVSLRWAKNICTAGVVLCAKGYPDNPQVGQEIFGLEKARKKAGLLVVEAGTRMEGGKRITSGGRVSMVIGLGQTVKEAARKAYAYIATPEEIRLGKARLGKVWFLGAHYRTDIAQRGHSRYGSA